MTLYYFVYCDITERYWFISILFTSFKYRWTAEKSNSSTATIPKNTIWRWTEPTIIARRWNIIMFGGLWCRALTVTYRRYDFGKIATSGIISVSRHNKSAYNADIFIRVEISKENAFFFRYKRPALKRFIVLKGNAPASRFFFFFAFYFQYRFTSIICRLWKRIIVFVI